MARGWCGWGSLYVGASLPLAGRNPQEKCDTPSAFNDVHFKNMNNCDTSSVLADFRSKSLIFRTLCDFCFFWQDFSESVGVLLQNCALGVVFGNHPQNPRNPQKWCHEARFRCLLPRAPVAQDDGSLSKLPQNMSSLEESVWKTSKGNLTSECLD